MTLYASADEALDLIPTIGSLLDSSVPSTSQAEGYAIVVSAEIDLHLAAHGYVMPVTSTEALASLNAVAQFGVAALITKAAFPAAEGIGGDKGSAAFFEAKYQAGLALVDKGHLIPDTAGESSKFAHGFPDVKPWYEKDPPF